jgi:hypothetical protein
MTSKRTELSDLQRQLLEAAVHAHRGKIWLPKAAADSLPTTYSALLTLQRRKLVEPERAKDPDVVSWKITKAGKEAVAPPKISRSVREKVAAATAAAAPAIRREAATPTPPSRSPRSAPAAASEATVSRGAKAKKASAPAKPAASPAKKPSAPAKKSGGRSRA